MQDNTPETEVVQEQPIEPEAPEAPEVEADEPAQLGIVDGGADPGDDELEDIELNGQVYRVPPDVRQALQRQATPVEPEPVTQPDTSDITQDEQHLAQIRAGIARYDNVDWDAWYEQDFMAAQAEYTRFNEMREAARATETRIASRKQEQGQRQRAEWQKRAEKVQADLKREIKGWGPELARKLTEFAAQSGLSQESIVQMNVDKPAIKLLHGAYLQAQAKDQQSQPQDVKPLRRPVKGKGQPAPRGLSDDLPIDEWMKRHQQMRLEN